MLTTPFSRWVLQAARRLISVWMAVLGILLVVSGDARVSSPAFQGMRGFAHTFGASPSLFWGIAAITCGVLIWPTVTRMVGLYLGLVWIVMYDIGFWLSITDRHTSATAAPTYVFIAINVAGVLVLERDRNRP